MNNVFTYSKYRNDNLPDLKMLFDIFFNVIHERLIKYETFAWLSCQRCGHYMRILLKVMSLH